MSWPLHSLTLALCATLVVVTSGLVLVSRYVKLSEPEAASLMLVEQSKFEPAPRSILPRAAHRSEQRDVAVETADPAHDAPASSLPVAAAEPSGDDSDATVYFDARPLRVARTMRMVVTAYSPDDRSCGIHADGRTAAGYSIWTNGMKLVAADTKVLPFKSVITVPGYNAGRPVPVLDRGGAIKGNRLDLLFPTHEQARAWGVRTLDVTVWEYAD